MFYEVYDIRNQICLAVKKYTGFIFSTLGESLRALITVAVRFKLNIEYCNIVENGSHYQTFFETFFDKMFHVINDFCHLIYRN